MFLFSPTLKKTLQMKFAPFHFLIRGQLKLYYLQGCVENVINKVCSLLFAFPRTIVIVNYLQAQEVWMDAGTRTILILQHQVLTYPV